MTLKKLVMFAQIEIAINLPEPSLRHRAEMSSPGFSGDSLALPNFCPGVGANRNGFRGCPGMDGVARNTFDNGDDDDGRWLRGGLCWQRQ